MADLPKLHHHKQSSRVGKSAALPVKSERRRLTSQSTRPRPYGGSEGTREATVGRGG